MLLTPLIWHYHANAVYSPVLNEREPYSSTTTAHSTIEAIHILMACRAGNRSSASGVRLRSFFAHVGHN
uniref:Secreted protein n=1 Tax=Steinernema glaseri TaxID=37863 RepID=A0A1I7Z1N2_9BILA